MPGSRHKRKAQGIGEKIGSFEENAAPGVLMALLAEGPMAFCPFIASLHRKSEKQDHQTSVLMESKQYSDLAANGVGCATETQRNFFLSFRLLPIPCTNI